MPALNADILYLLFNSANMNRWNDHMRPVDLTELDKQAHKAAIAWVLGRFEESHGNGIVWRDVIEHTLFSFIQRSVLTDLKPQVFHRIAAERRGPVNAFVVSEFDRLVPKSDPAFRQRLIDYLDSEKDSREDKVIRAAHYLATRWEFNLIYDSNRSLYGIEATRGEIDEQIYQHMDLVGVSEIMASEDTFNFIDLIGQLRFQQRWARTPRIPKTTVLGHSLMVADMMYLHDLDEGANDERVYNDFYTGLFHDLPEVLTKDVISPIKENVSGLAAILEGYERDLVESKIMPLLREDWRDGFRHMVYDPFSDIDVLGFGARNGVDLKACDLMAAYMEAFISRRYGITSNTLQEGERTIRDKLVERGSGINARELMEDLDRMRI
ncbi:MAG: HD domain-containing protein [Thermoplasmata archaeon]|nr:HD domain-containing protein [Thermoplasmata archaeon]